MSIFIFYIFLVDPFFLFLLFLSFFPHVHPGGINMYSRRQNCQYKTLLYNESPMQCRGS